MGINDTNYIYLYEVFCLFSGNFDKAINDMQEALHLDPNFESAEHCLLQSTEDKKARELKNQNLPGNNDFSS